MKIAVGSDHAGFEDPPPHYKPAVIEHLKELGHEVIDCGTDSAEAVDYPDYGREVAQKVTDGEADRGILICGTGIGISIAANRFPAVRAAVVCSDQMAEVCRSHNNANIICVGRRSSTLEEVLRYIDTFLSTDFSSAERHHRRVEKMSQ